MTPRPRQDDSDGAVVDIAETLLSQAMGPYFPERVTADDAVGGIDRAQVSHHLSVAAQRSPGEVLVEVRAAARGSITVTTVTDDMPRLVEGVSSALGRLGLSVWRIDHPVLSVWRDAAGQLLAIGTPDSADNGEPGERIAESWIHVEAQPIRPGSVDAPAVRDRVAEVIGRVVDVHRDHRAMTERLRTVADRCGADAGQYPALLRWMAGGMFAPIGWYTVDQITGAPEAAGQGVWRSPDFPRPDRDAVVTAEQPLIRRIHFPTAILRTDYPTLLQVAEVDDTGAPVREHVFIGVLTPTALHENVLEIPVVRERVADALAVAGADIDSYSGQAMLELLQGYPLSEIFASDAGQLAANLRSVLDAVPGGRLRVFLRSDPHAETLSALIYLPRDKYNTRTRQQMQTLLRDEFGSEDIEYTVRVSVAAHALLHLLMRVPAATGDDIAPEVQRRLQDALVAASRGWDDGLRELVDAGVQAGSTSAPVGPETIGHYIRSLGDGYKEERDPAAALADITRLATLAPGDFSVDLRRVDDVWRFGLYLCGRSATLTDVLPVLQSLGVDVLDERPFEVTRPDGERCRIYEFGLSPTSGMVIHDGPAQPGAGAVETRVTEAFSAVWRGHAAVDSFNELVLRCGLDWRQAAMLRSYARYLRQCGFAYSASHVASVLGAHADICRGLVELFFGSFDPDGADEDRRQGVVADLDEMVGDIVSLDADRIVSAFVAMIGATVRTNFFVTDPDDGGHRPVLSFKLRPRDIPQTPQPRPLYEIFVYSPRIEGVHLRFGSVARGGLRWSDRRDDYRTEILGLVKAQAVKNAVIVPVGAKGGFVVKRPPAATGDPAVDRDAFRQEGIACYRRFIGGLLDITDNLDRSTGEVLPARSVVRRDGDDTYLVVAADKGTATFSDIANDVAAGYDFWLGDAFASGGSAGYDHKVMGITARGAWEAVRRHFREMGVDTQSEDFAVVGVGDMSGDVFGNGMLLSKHIRLVAAFDHRHVFIDPDPDAATSYVERRRLFDLPRSSWADYDPALISTGGGVWSRDLKSIPISAQIRAALGLDDGVTALSPPDLMRAILTAPVDLLWNGGIGTYVKASGESNDDVGDKANDAIRVNGDQVRAKVIGEGGNLGVTARGRIEFDLSGGRVNTDAMDNSAGVDCSDHEVNIKILLDAQVSSGALAAADRNPLLESMTDEVGDLVLADNISQNAELGLARAGAGQSVDVHVRLLRELAGTYGVDLELEALPTVAALRKRVAASDSSRPSGLTSPELATVLAHVKLGLKSDLLSTELPDGEVFGPRLHAYFPLPLRERFAEGIAEHRLRRQIVTTSLVNDVVDKAGITHAFRLAEGAMCSPIDVVRAYVVVSTVFALDDLWARIEAVDGGVVAIDEMMTYTRRLLFRASRWMLANRPQPLPIAAEITRYARRVQDLSPRVPGWLGPGSRADVATRVDAWVADGVDESLAADAGVSLHRFCLLDIIDAAEIADRDEIEVGELYFTVLDDLGVEGLLTAVSRLDRGDRWHALARLALRDDLHAVVRSLCLQIMEVGEPGESPRQQISEWQTHHASRLARVRAVLDDIAETGDYDLATLSVAARQLRSVIR
ncbi:NAD-glutamate dehydrogenase [Williamsia sterculiae]|uniref:Glutamate dehydrogenase n=1 Tax=Williamsia sterculiae TaxID=1344003 RepID=A0A1N7GKH3_9NOCA|nr:NAD-glutamate dehydrogenase [Williamsia sterculiae]SIS13016.1 glutamate dehydrogenase [Williamsia sterculiae]